MIIETENGLGCEYNFIYFNPEIDGDIVEFTYSTLEEALLASLLKEIEWQMNPFTEPVVFKSGLKVTVMATKTNSENGGYENVFKYEHPE